MHVNPSFPYLNRSYCEGCKHKQKAHSSKNNFVSWKH